MYTFNFKDSSPVILSSIIFHEFLITVCGVRKCTHFHISQQEKYIVTVGVVIYAWIIIMRVMRVISESHK